MHTRTLLPRLSLSREDRESIIQSSLPIIMQGRTPSLPISLRYDARYGWDFSVSRKGKGIEIIVSISLEDPRFGMMMREMGEAILRVDRGEEGVWKGRGPLV